MIHTSGLSTLSKACMRLSKAVSFLCAAAMLCVVPLLYRDAFFDINRCKVDFITGVTPALSLLTLALSALTPGRARRGWWRAAAPCVSFAVFLLCCTLSCARLGFAQHLLTGSEGRYGGLWFLLSCGAAFFAIAAGALHARALTALIMLTSAICAALGVVNAMGFDPLGFYARIRKGQEVMFMSTIGHFDFFGTYIVMMLGLCGGQFVRQKAQAFRAFGALCAFLCAMAAYASRTDSAFLGVHIVCAALLAVSGGDFGAIRRALFLWAMCVIALPLTLHTLSFSRFSLSFSAPSLLLGRVPVAGALCLLLLIAAYILTRLQRRGAKPISQKATLCAVGLLALLAAIALVGLMVYFTFIAPEAELGGAANILRLDEQWGSLRGYVYKWALQAYGDYSPIEKLLGRGLETTLTILRPYFDDPAGLASGVFNDTHCQPLQYLLTGGLLTALAFVAFYLCMTIAAGRFAGRDPLLCGLFSALVCYGMIMLLNVAQPILLATFFSISALAVSRIRHLSIEGEGDDLES